MNLNIFSKLDFLPALHTFFEKLNIPINHVADEPTTAKEILSDTYKNNDTFNLTNDVYFVGMVDDAAFENNKESIKLEDIKTDYDGILIFGITLHDRPNGLLPTRTQLADIARAFNREFYYTPVVIVFKYNNHIAFANTERLKYKQEWREGEKAGKVTILRDVKISNPHAGHQRILEGLKIPTKGRNSIDSFTKLYNYWQEVLSVNILNKKFYKELSNWYFWAVQNVQFPGKPTLEDAIKTNKELDDLKQEHKATNVIRMLTRLLFVWFLKEKQLIPGELFDLKALQEDILNKIDPIKNYGVFKEENIESVYYKAILQNLFFATLNCPIESDSIDNRKRGFRLPKSNFGTLFLMRYEEYFKDKDAFLEMVNQTVPFLNGGLFECLDERGEGEKKDERKWIDGFSDNLPKDQQLVVPDYLFFGREEETDLSDVVGISTREYKQAAVKGLINILESYKFTITENTPIEEDVALDPELLGKVFENLLASYNPETKTTARKQTGSFYTPREIVNYMVDESLIAYLTTVLEASSFEKLIPKQDASGTSQDALRQLVSFDPVNPFNDNKELTKKIITALNSCTILDPACGSGAFPMGILQKMVHILQKLDPNNKVWKEVQREKANAESEEAFEKLEDKNARAQRLIEINEAFDESTNDPDYARKLFLIENCIYGVDIQPIATQISKLRFFISLVVEQKVNPEKENFGIRPLPNLETKFVAANTLIGIDRPKKGDQLNMFSTERLKELETELKQVRSKLFGAKTKDTKVKYRNRDEELRNAIAVELQHNGWETDNAQKLAGWDPYDQNATSDFFDPEWMFDIKEGFDVVIGNPPYGVSIKGENRTKVLNFLNKVPDFEIYYFFIEIGYKFISKNGTLSYIIPNTYLFNVFAETYRQKLLDNYGINFIIDFTNYSLFETATVRNSVFVLSKGFSDDKIKYIPTSNSELTLDEFIEQKVEVLNKSLLNDFSQNWALAFKLPKVKIDAISSLKKHTSPLSNYFTEFSQGLIAYDKYRGQSAKIIENRAFHFKNFQPGLKKWMWGEDVRKYQVNWNGKEYIDYSSGIANPRQPKFFQGKRMLVREITNPTIFAAITDKEMYNDPAIIIVLDSDHSIEAVTMILNSCVGTFYHFNASPKATKGAFPKILVKDLKEFPLPYNFEELNKRFWSILYEIISFSVEHNKSIKSNSSIIDAVCLNLYFPDYMQKKEIDVINYVENDIESLLKDRKFDSLNDEEKESIINQLHTIWNDPNNEVVKRIGMFREKSPDLLGVILDS